MWPVKQITHACFKLKSDLITVDPRLYKDEGERTIFRISEYFD